MIHTGTRSTLSPFAARIIRSFLSGGKSFLNREYLEEFSNLWVLNKNGQTVVEDMLVVFMEGQVLEQCLNRMIINRIESKINIF